MKLDNFRWQFIERQWVKVWTDRTSEMTDKIKHMMTRKEAIECFKRHSIVSHPEELVNLYIDAGMLEIKEDENIYTTNVNRERFRSMLARLGHEEATVYGHWALAAYDLAFPSK